MQPGRQFVGPVLALDADQRQAVLQNRQRLAVLAGKMHQPRLAQDGVVKAIRATIDAGMLVQRQVEADEGGQRFIIVQILVIGQRRFSPVARRAQPQMMPDQTQLDLVPGQLRVRKPGLDEGKS